MTSNNPISPPDATTNDKRKENIVSSVFLMTVGGASLVSGFGLAFARARKSDPGAFDQGVVGSGGIEAIGKAAKEDAKLAEAGAQLALRALGRATVYAVGGFALFCGTVWKLSGAKDLQDFRMKAGGILPKIPKNDPPQSRTEFSGLNDLLQYVIDEDEKKKLENCSN